MEAKEGRNGVPPLDGSAGFHSNPHTFMENPSRGVTGSFKYEISNDSNKTPSRTLQLEVMCEHFEVSPKSIK